MGEAKHRKANDPNYGKIPKGQGNAGASDGGNARVPRLPDGGRGLVISCPMKISGNQLSLGSSDLDRQELRAAALLWDRLVWPSSRAIYIGGGMDAGYLQQVGLLYRPEYTVWGDAAQGMAQTQIAAYRELEEREPGQWALAQGERSLMVESGLVENDRGVLVELHRALPIPDQDVALEEVLNFKAKRADALAALRAELDECYLLIDSANDTELAEAAQFRRVDAACADMVKLAREEAFPFRLSSLAFSFTTGAVKAGSGGWKLGELLGMPQVGAALGGIFGGSVAAGMKMHRDLGLLKTKVAEHPYRFVYHAHDELFR